MLVSEVLFCGAWVLILYTYLVFPVLLSLFARVFAHSRTEPIVDLSRAELPRVAVVIAAYNEEAVIAAKLDNCWQIDYPQDRFSVYIGSDGSHDQTPEILRRCENPLLHAVIFPQRRGKISVLNDLVVQIDTDILVMTDASTLFAPDAVQKLVRQFRDPRMGCVTGELSIETSGDVSGEGFYLKYERWIKRGEGALGCVIGCFGPIFAMRRSLYRPLPPSTIVEDLVFCLRVLEQGFLTSSEPQAHATDPACATMRGEMARKIRIGAGGFQTLGITWPLLMPQFGFCAFAYWGHKVLRWLVPLFFLVGFIANAILVLSPADSAILWVFRAALLFQVMGSLIAWTAYKLPSGRKMPRWTRPVSYFYLMNYGLFRGLLRFLFNTQKVTWERAEAAASPASLQTVLPLGTENLAITARESAVLESS